jgi:hypothetical protein
VRCLLTVDSLWAGDIEDIGQLIHVSGRQLGARRRTVTVPEPEQAGMVDPVDLPSPEPSGEGRNLR